MKLLFPTVIHELKVDNFKSIKSELVKFAYEEKEKDPNGLILSNMGGWQSQSNYNRHDNILLSTISKSLAPYFKSNIVDMSKEIHYNNMWININKKGDYNATHDHPKCHMAGVFWTHSPGECGLLELQNPHSFSMGTEMMMYTEEFQKKSNAYPVYMFPPTEGSILLFPSCINHRVTVNESDGERVSSAFNLSFKI